MNDNQIVLVSFICSLFGITILLLVIFGIYMKLRKARGSKCKYNDFYPEFQVLDHKADCPLSPFDDANLLKISPLEQPTIANDNATYFEKLPKQLTNYRKISDVNPPSPAVVNVNSRDVRKERAKGKSWIQQIGGDLNDIPRITRSYLRWYPAAGSKPQRYTKTSKPFEASKTSKTDFKQDNINNNLQDVNFTQSRRNIESKSALHDDGFGEYPNTSTLVHSSRNSSILGIERNVNYFRRNSSVDPFRPPSYTTVNEHPTHKKLEKTSRNHDQANKATGTKANIATTDLHYEEYETYMLVQELQI